MDVNYWKLTPLVVQRFEKTHFPVVPLGSVLTTVQYGSSSRAKPDPPGVPILRMNNLQDDGWDLSDLKYIELSQKDLELYRLAPGDILFNRTNSKELVGKCAVFNENGDWVFASYLIRVRTVETHLLPQFATDFLGTQIGRLQIDRVSRQIIGMTNINAEEIRELEIPLPSIEQQAMLIHAMNKARKERELKLEQAFALMEDTSSFLLEALNLTAVTESPRKVFAIKNGEISLRLDPHFHSPEFAQIQKMLSQIHCEPLGSLVSFSREMWKPEASNGSTFRYIEIGNVNPKTGEAFWNVIPTNEAPSRARMKVHTNDIIVSLTRPQHGSIALLSQDFDGCVASTGFAVIRGISRQLDRNYLWCILRAQFTLRQMLQRASGGNYPAITESELRKIVIPVPSKAIQGRIAEEVDRRRRESHRLIREAKANWQFTKMWFEEQLLGAFES